MTDAKGQAIFSKLPVNDAAGNTITYTIQETIPDGYMAASAMTTTISAGATVIASIPNTEKTYTIAIDCKDYKSIDNELLMHFRAKKKTSKEVSLYEPIGTDKEGNQIQLLDVVVSEDEDVVELLEQDRKVRRLNEIIPQTLSGRELFIIINRYGLYGKKTMTQREIARKLGISRSYVSRIEKRAIEKLRQAF